MDFDEIIKRLDRIEMFSRIAAKPTLTLKEAAEYLGITDKALYSAKQRIPHYKAGKHLYFDKIALDEYMHSRKVMTEDDFEKMARAYCDNNLINYRV